MGSLVEFDWDSLELRRKYLSIIQMYKIIFGYCDTDSSKFYDIVGLSQNCSNHKFKIRPKAAHTNCFKHSFFKHYINDWNSFLSSVMSLTSINSFKAALLNYLHVPSINF